MWRFHLHECLKSYRLCTVTYGTAPAAFLATRTLKQLAINEQLTFPEATQVILEDFYVDDLLTGTNSIQQTIQLKSDLQKLLSSRGFELRKWSSKNSSIINAENHLDIRSQLESCTRCFQNYH